MVTQKFELLIVISTLVFLIAPASIILYISIYNRRKHLHIQEKAQMKLQFETEMIKTQLEVQEQTLQTIGADLHDNIGQLLSLASLTLSSIDLGNLDKTRQKIDDAVAITNRSIKEMRLLGKLLQGDQLIGMGLPEAIRHEINWMEKTGHYEISYIQPSETPVESNADKDLIVFRILQEVFNNIIKHSWATKIDIKLRYTDGFMTLLVTDNGKGFDPEILPEEQRGMGLQNIQNRTSIIGGKATFQSHPGEGTAIELLIPYP